MNLRVGCTILRFFGTDGVLKEQHGEKPSHSSAVPKPRRENKSPNQALSIASESQDHRMDGTVALKDHPVQTPCCI